MTVDRVHVRADAAATSVGVTGEVAVLLLVDDVAEEGVETAGSDAKVVSGEARKCRACGLRARVRLVMGMPGSGVDAALASRRLAPSNEESRRW